MNKHIGFNTQVTNEINNQVIDLFVKAFEFKTQHDLDSAGYMNENYIIDAQDAFWKVVDQCVKEFEECVKEFEEVNK